MVSSRSFVRAAKELLKDADLHAEANMVASSSALPLNAGARNSSVSSTTSRKTCPFSFVPLKMGGNGGTHKPSLGSQALIDYEVCYDDLLKMTNTFYENAFQDFTLDKFIRSHEDPHGERFAKWIHQKLSGGNLWDLDRQARDKTPVRVSGGQMAVVHDRSSAHAAAWFSPKRPKEDVGRHFTLEECRVWMRLHFWAMRESGIMQQSPSFADYYVRFIGHFVSVYERTAPAFARDSLRWSANPSNVEKYLQNGRKMTDVLGLNFSQHCAQLPDDELNDDEWPYNLTEPEESR